MEQHTSVSHPVVKLFTAWGAVIGISSWSDLAALAAFLYSLILIGEWAYNRFLKKKKA